jgi:hypothetical protein
LGLIICNFEPSFVLPLLNCLKAPAKSEGAITRKRKMRKKTAFVRIEVRL